MVSKNNVMEKLRQKVQKYVEQNYPKDIEQLDSISEEAWMLYRDLLDKYRSGEVSRVGWYETILFWMNFWKVHPETAHILASIRDKLD